jgi:glycosyltransferase involved in cell wall biosynthesis
MTSAPLSGARIGLLTASASRAGGGVFEAIAAHVEMLRELGATPVVAALNDQFVATDRARLGDAELVLADVAGPRPIGYAPSLVGRLHEARLDLLHLHGIWMYPSRAGLVWARQTGRPYVISPHGMLEPWTIARGKWKKALARSGYERASWAAASAFHALTGGEGRDIAAETGRTDTLVIPNAGPAPGPAPTRLRPPNVVYIGRIHPKKNFAGLVAGWAAAKRPADARLTIAGWGDPADVAALHAILAGREDPSVEFVGPVYGEAKQRLLEAARYVILPSFSEGLPMAILEAWAAGAPTIMTDECNLPEGFEHGAAMRCGTAPDDIARAIESGLALDEAEWLAMARVGQALVAGPFSAESISNRWGEAYAALLAERR